MHHMYWGVPVWGELGWGRFLQCCAQVDRALLSVQRRQVRRHLDLAARGGPVETPPGVTARAPSRAATLRRGMLTHTRSVGGLVGPP